MAPVVGAMIATSDISQHYTPRGAARALLNCHDREVLIEGPAGTGKTRAVLEMCNALAMKYPGFRGCLVRETRASMTETILVTWERDVWCRAWDMAPDHQRSTRTHYDYPNGSTVVIAGMDTPQRILSGEYDWVGALQAEELKLDSWETLLTRLRAPAMPWKQAVADCNPSYPGHWLNKRANAGMMKRLLSRHSDNPQVTPEYLATLDRLTGARRLRLRDGKWAGSEGVVYDRWDRAVHVKVREGPWARILVGVDYGYTNPTAVVRCCVDGDGRVHVEHERYAKGLSEAQQVAHVGACGEGAEVLCVDPSAAGLRAALSATGLAVIEADNDVVAGINRVQDRLQVAGDGLPRLTVDPSCTNLIDEFESYEWLPEKPKDTPKKENDHALDALRYAVMHVDSGMVYDVVGVSLHGDRPVSTSAEFIEAGRRARADYNRRWDMGLDLAD